MLNKTYLRKMKISLRKLRFEIKNDTVNLCLQISGVIQNKKSTINSDSEYFITNVIFCHIL